MSKFNDYARRFDEEVKSYRGRYQKASERLQKAQKALQEAEEQNRLPHRNETTLQVIRRERELVDVRAKAEEARIEFDQVRADRYSVLKKADLIRAELADEVSRAYNADPADIDHATMTLLESGILTALEIEKLSNDAISSENWTMSRIIGAHAKQNLENNEKRFGANHPDNVILRNVIHRSMTNDGRKILSDFDALKNVAKYALGDPSGFSHRDENPQLMERWEEIAGQVIEEF